VKEAAGRALGGQRGFFDMVSDGAADVAGVDHDSLSSSNDAAGGCFGERPLGATCTRASPAGPVVRRRPRRCKSSYRRNTRPER
jgi:hypothetical protein